MIRVNAAQTLQRTGIVIIGRNEGARLLACLESVRSANRFVVYVDSGSTDGSVDLARARCDETVELSANRRFSAARARNAGFAVLVSALPGIEFVQFLDGDCTLLPNWLESAERAMDADLQRAIVIGTLQERRPDASVYNRLCALEWNSRAGDLDNLAPLGGIMLVRKSVFEQHRGFDETVIAGEDAEFGVRVANANSKITKIAYPMATHDADMNHFRQWWQRAIRGGHAIGQRYQMNGRGPSRDCARERRSVLFWGLGLPVAALAFAPFTSGLSFLALGGYGVLAMRIYRYRRSNGDSPADARLYARFVVLGKFAEAIGYIKFKISSVSGDYRIIEYK